MILAVLRASIFLFVGYKVGVWRMENAYWEKLVDIDERVEKLTKACRFMGDTLL